LAVVGTALYWWPSEPHGGLKQLASGCAGLAMMIGLLSLFVGAFSPLMQTRPKNPRPLSLYLWLASIAFVLGFCVPLEIISNH
jgi:hypothetical protein